MPAHRMCGWADKDDAVRGRVAQLVDAVVQKGMGRRDPRIRTPKNNEVFLRNERFGRSGGHDDLEGDEWLQAKNPYLQEEE